MSALDRCRIHHKPLEFATDQLGRSVWSCSTCQRVGLPAITTPVVEHRQCVDCRGAIIGKTSSIRCLPCRQDHERAYHRDYNRQLPQVVR